MKKDKKEVTIYSIFMFVRSTALDFVVDKWVGVETDNHYKVYHMPEYESDRLSEGYKLLTKEDLKQVYINDNIAQVRTMNPESIEDWKGKLIEEYSAFLIKRLNRAQEQLTKFVNTVVEFRAEKYKENAK